MNILNEWELTVDTLVDLLDENPSLRGVLFWYVAERKLKETMTSFPGVSYVGKPDDHGSSRKKWDFRIAYRGREFRVVSKPLQSKSIRRDKNKSGWRGRCQLDAGDRRAVALPSGRELDTTLLPRGEFDILAVNCYAVEREWKFLFARNSELPHPTHRMHSLEARRNLIASSVPVSLPPKPPFHDNLKKLLDGLVADGAGSVSRASRRR